MGKPTKATLKKITAVKRAAGKKAKKAAGMARALAMKKKGVGIFAPKVLSPALATICGGKKMARTEVTKKIWAYIKKNKLNDGRTIKPDSTLKAVFPVASIDMLKMAGYVSKHLSALGRAPAIQPKSSDVAPGSRVATSRVRLLSFDIGYTHRFLPDFSSCPLATLACSFERRRGRPGETQPRRRQWVRGGSLQDLDFPKSQTF